MRTRSSEQQDYILRLIEQAAEALRRLMHRVAGRESPDILRQDAATAISMLLGAEGTVYAVLDPDSAVRLVGDRERVTLWAALLDVEADAAGQAGDVRAATSGHMRAEGLRAALERIQHA